MVIAVLAGAAVLSDESHDASAPDLAIAGFDAEVTGGQVDADVTVQNTTKLRLKGSAWWVLSLEDESDPWGARIYRSEPREIDLTAGEQVRVEWSEVPPVHAGRYRLSAWVHVEDRERILVHSDADESSNRVIELTGSKRLVRSTAQAGPVAITDATSVSTPGFPTEVAVDASIASSEQSSELHVSALILEGDAADPRWWAVAPIAELDSVVLQVDSQVTTASLGGTVMLSPGEYAIALSVRDQRGNEDRVLLSESAFVVPEFDSSLNRDSMPDGPLMFLAIDASEQWESINDQAVTVRVKNTSGRQAIGIFWWHLAGPGNPEPWNAAVATSHSLEQTFEPNEIRTIRLVPDGDPAPGEGRELSVWVHYLDGSFTGQHSDGARFSDLIDVASVRPEDEDS